jgi:hypothetical protein
LLVTDYGIEVGPDYVAPSELGPFLEVARESFIGHLLLEGAIQLCAFASQPASIEPIELVTDGLLDSAASVRELPLRDEPVDTLEGCFSIVIATFAAPMAGLRYDGSSCHRGRNLYKRSGPRPLVARGSAVEAGHQPNSAAAEPPCR